MRLAGTNNAMAPPRTGREPARPRVVLALFAALLIGFPLYGQDLDREITAIQDAIQAGDLDGASRSISAALARYPNAAGLINLRGVVHATREELPAARADFQRAVRLDPRLVPAWQNLARACQSLTGTDASAAACAIRGWQQVLRARPQDAEARFSLATVYEWQGQFAESLSHLQRLPAEESARARVLALRCAGLTGLGRIEEANQAAIALANAADFTEADATSVFPVLEAPRTAPVMVALVESLDARNRASQSSLEHLAAAYQELKRLPEARKVLERVAVLDPSNPRHLMALARVAYFLNDREGALGYLAHARELAPKDSQVHFLWGMIALEMDLPVEARRSLERAVGLEPRNPRYNYALGWAALSAGDTSGAVPYLRTYIAAQPKDPRGHFALGIVHFATNDFNHARQEMEQIRTNPETAAGAEYILGRIARIEDKLEEAAAHLQRSIDLLASFAESHAELGRVRLLQGNLKQAQAELDRALSLDRDSFQANATLLTLYQQTRDPRLKQQGERLRQLDSQRYARKELMLRTIEVKPY